MNEQYLQLVKDAKKFYSQECHQNSKLDLTWFESEDKGYCKEINLWTYWQGFGYADHSPEIDYLVVGQDWGNVDSKQCTDILKRIAQMNAGDETVTYLDEEKGEISSTNINLAELCKVLGFGDERDSILAKRYSKLFFTNFSLGYRHGRQTTSGGMTKGLLKKDAELFTRLVKVLKPKRIICLGKLTFECVLEAMGVELSSTERKLLKIGYNDFLEMQNGFMVPNTDIWIYPVAHCGARGTINRNRKKINYVDKLFLQKKDWEKAKIR